MPVNHYDPRSLASSRRPPRFSASQSQLWPARSPKRPARFPSKILGLPSAHQWQCSASRIPSASFQGPFQCSDPPKLLQMTSLRSLPRFAAGQEASHWPANEIANTEDFSSCEQDSLTSLQQKEPPKRQPGGSLRGSAPHINRPTRLRLEVLFATLFISFRAPNTAPRSAARNMRPSASK